MEEQEHDKSDIGYSAIKENNSQKHSKKTSAEEILAYATKVLNRESNFGLADIINCKLQENPAKSSCYSSCLACEANKVLTISKSVQQSKVVSGTKNPAYGRQTISRPMRIVAPIPQ